MKKKIIFTIIVILMIAIIAYLLIFNLNKKVLLDNENQVELLSEMYKDFVLDTNINEYNISLDDSAIKNLITKEYFDESSIDILKQVETSYSDSKSDYILSLKYDYNKKIIELTLKNDSGNMIRQKYILKIKNGKINYEKYDNGFIMMS